jgi:tetratricopeptide (TPR) repeat protein
MTDIRPGGRSWRHGGIVLALLLSLAAAAVAQDAAAPAKPGQKPAYEETAPIKCTLIVGKLPTEAELIGRAREINRLVTKINFKQILVDPATVVAVDFSTEYVDDTVEVLLRDEKYQEAADMLVNAYALTVPYLDLVENNAVEPLMNAGSHYLLAAEKESLKTGVIKVTPAAEENYKRAYKVYRAVVKAEWYSGAKVAEVKGLFCLLRMGMADAVEKALEDVTEPDHGDAAFGVYWMVRAYLYYQKQSLRDAIEASARSLVFETKDLDSFPEALFLSAQCYEDMFEYHRARDTYYEVAKLFQRTDLGEIAFRRLQVIMEQGHTRKEEEKSIEKVFFDSTEDMNVMADEFIAAKVEEERLRQEQEALKKKQEELEKQITP